MGDLWRVKTQFFTQQKVKDQLDPATRQRLTKFGAFVRRRAKSSLKYAAGEAAPGRPPHVHYSGSFVVRRKVKGITQKQQASPLRELTFFSYERTTKSVVIGPAIGGSRSGAPRTIEEGGQARIDGRTVHVRPRPWVRPAFELELAKVGGDFRNIIK